MRRSISARRNASKAETVLFQSEPTDSKPIDSRGKKDSR